MSVWHGWLRYPGHFLIAGGIPHVIAILLAQFGIHNAWLALASMPLLALLTVIFLTWEIHDVVKDKHTFGKAALDFISKEGGFALAMTTWTVW